MTKQKIFFSYSRADGADFALRLALDLKRNGFDVWIDQKDIRAGSEWDIEIEKALETCDCLLFIETQRSVTSSNVLDEVYYALENHKKVIPLILIDSKTPFRLQRLQHINFAKDYDSGLAHLINELEHGNAATAFLPDESKPPPNVDKAFYTKHSGLIIILLVIVLAAAIIYFAGNKNEITLERNTVVNSTDTNTNDEKLVDTEPKDTVKENAAEIEGTQKNSGKPTTTKNKNLVKKNNVVVNKTDDQTNLTETFAGDWELVDVEPKARLKRGYLKIEAIGQEKVAIKSNLQFYYFPTNETSFLSVFNAFAGCSSCTLKREMNIIAEDVSIGSRIIKTLKEDQPDGGKAGDTTMDAGLNKSISASVTLQLLNNRSIVIKVKKTNSVELADDLVLEPFVYTFLFKQRQ